MGKFGGKFGKNEVRQGSKMCGNKGKAPGKKLKKQLEVRKNASEK